MAVGLMEVVCGVSTRGRHGRRGDEFLFMATPLVVIGMQKDCQMQDSVQLAPPAAPQ